MNLWITNEQISSNNNPRLDTLIIHFHAKLSNFSVRKARQKGLKFYKMMDQTAKILFYNLDLLAIYFEHRIKFELFLVLTCFRNIHQ